MAIAREGGREARTNWSVARRFPRSARSLLEVRPETGRTHQIRVHLAAVGLPIAGDPVYGRRGRDRAEPGLDRPALHARVLGLIHPRTGERMRFEAEMPADIQARIAALERREQASRSEAKPSEGHRGGP
jgi:23S rRNA pseudouridine1911/1915/1917 synthase